MPADLPPNEAQRLRTLSLYRVLDTASEQTFDDLTRLASAICGTPIALTSLVDEKRQWFKSRVGLGAAETSRDVAFCSHAILSKEVFVVNDTHEDVRFAENPLVTSDPNIRFYAGAPLEVANGQRLGTLCVIDREPRALSPLQLDALMTLRNAVVTQLELRRALADLSQVEKLLSICAWCRKVRDADGAWVSLHDFVAAGGGVTHGICAECERDF